MFTSLPSIESVLGRSSTPATSTTAELNGNADLLRGEPYAVRIVHGFQHVLGELADFGINLRNRDAFLAERRMTILHYFEDHS
jgi:hypothetical protein